jgi:peroxiredoxin
MHPTLKDGDRVLVLRYWPSIWLRKGQIVVVSLGYTNITQHRADATASLFIKRIVGMPGDTLLTCITELDDFHRQRELAAHDTNGHRIWNIPERHIFVRGDHPIGGFDSLSWGPIPFGAIFGIAVSKLPYSKSGKLLTNQPALRIGLPVGQDAPSFTAKTVTGQIITLENFNGGDIALVFISPCDACRKIIPQIEASYPKAFDAGVQMVLISDAREEATRAFVNELKISLPVLIAPHDSNPFWEDYNITGRPAYCLISKEGKIISVGFPSTKWGDWRSLVDLWNNSIPINRRDDDAIAS